MASKTFGGALSIYSGGSYVAINGLLDVSWPTYKADDPIDITSHGSTSGVREYEEAGTKDHTEFAFECNDLPADPGQIAVAAAIGGAAVKFKFVKVAGAVTSYRNVLVGSFTSSGQPVNGKSTMSCSGKATGVDPTS